ncbi:MAG: hypothetical protein WAW90_00750, partial [Minisyncoccia bacterium]
MSKKLFTNAIAILLTIAIVTPVTFFIAPQRAQAQQVVNDPPVWYMSGLNYIKTQLLWVEAHINTVMVKANYWLENVLEPLAYVLSGNLMKDMTASVVAFVNGIGNGSGSPQFTTGLQKSMQSVSDVAARAYLAQIGLTGSPFSSSITVALGRNYMQNTSLGGFWAANKNTMSQSSSNPSAFMAGDWSKGGVAAWLSLTTQPQNNPYMLFNNSRDQLANVIGPGGGGVTGIRQQELAWGKGFSSWCGATEDSSGTGADAAPIGDAPTDPVACSVLLDAACNGSGMNGQCDLSKGICQTAESVNSSAVKVGDSCFNKDGTPGTIKTPGSVISSTLE